MLRTACFALLFAASIPAAFAQVKAAQPGKFDAPPPGSYKGTLKDSTGARSSDVQIDIRDVTKDGRVSARTSATSTPNPACGKNLATSGIMLEDSSMRLEVDAGAPEGCERIYNVKASGGTLSGTFIDGNKSAKSGMKK